MARDQAPSAKDQAPSLDTLRKRIDSIDAELHRLLIERMRIVEGIAAAKRASGAGPSPFRPAREAEVMQQLVERHEGPLPLVSAEHIWRELISASSQIQGGYKVFIDGSADAGSMIDLARFQFGFCTELETLGDSADVIGCVAASEKDLGLIGLMERADLPWWRGLGLDGARIVARLPFLASEDRPADLPAVIISRALPDELDADTSVYDARWLSTLPGSLMDSGIEVLSFYRTAEGVDALLAVSSDLSEDEIIKACAEAGAEPDVLRAVGGYVEPIDIDTDDDFEADADTDTSAGTD